MSEENEPGRGLSHSRFGAALAQSATRRKGHSPARIYCYYYIVSKLPSVT